MSFLWEWLRAFRSAVVLTSGAGRSRKTHGQETDGIRHKMTNSACDLQLINACFRPQGKLKVIVSVRDWDRMEEDEKSSLLQGDTTTANRQLPAEGNQELSCSSTRQCKVYKRRWYVLFVFTLTSIVSNFMWNTWGPIQRPCRLVFGWERWTVLLLSSFGAIGPILGAFPSTWLMDTKGISIFVI